MFFRTVFVLPNVLASAKENSDTRIKCRLFYDCFLMVVKSFSTANVSVENLRLCTAHKRHSQSSTTKMPLKNRPIRLIGNKKRNRLSGKLARKNSTHLYRTIGNSIGLDMFFSSCCIDFFRNEVKDKKQHKKKTGQKTQYA